MNIDLALIKDFGFSGALLLILWKAAAWFQPRVDKVVDATVENAGTLKVLAATVDMQHGNLKEHILELKKTVDAIWDLLNREDAK